MAKPYNKKNGMKKKIEKIKTVYIWELGLKH